MKKITFLMSIVFMPWAIGNGQFEEGVAEKDSSKKVHVDVGGAFAMQYQHLNHEADSALIPLGKGINLPTANLDIRAYLVPGIMINLTTYLSSRHHVEAWVKGGYLMIDEIPFIKWNALDKAMDYLTLKIGDMEINYGDAHFRRSDNGNVNKNPFVGNYIMDAFVTSPALEILFQNKGWLAMGAISSGNLKPALTGYNESTDTYTNYNLAEELAFYGKLGFDKQLLSFRFRTTVSAYYCGNNHAGALYYGDRAGSRYYLVMNKQEGSNSVDPAHNHTSGRWGPGFTDRDRSFMVNLYTRYLGFELFGTYENVDGTNLGGAEFDYNQYAIEGLYYFGKEDQFYGGVRYNYVKDDTGMSIDRFQASIGWFLTEHIKAKVEYVNQNYNEFITYGDNAAFNGIMVEAGISF